MKKSFIEKLLSSHFHHLGKCIGKRPLIFLCLSVLFPMILLLGFLRFHHLQDFEELFMTQTGRSAKDMKFIEKTFPLNFSETIDLERATRTKGAGTIIIVAKDGGTVFRKELSEEIVSLYNDIHNLSVEWKGKYWNFSSICSPWWFGECMENSASEIFTRLNDFNAGKFRPVYPIDWKSYKKGMTVTAMNFGGVERDEKQRIISAKAVRLFFQLEFRNEEKLSISHLWEEKFIEEMETKRYKHIDVCIFTSMSIAKELTKTTLQGMPFGSLSIAAIIAFAVLTSLTSDPVKSKPWLGLAGGISALLGLASSFGFLFLVGMPYIDIVLSVPYIMLGIGIDDSFVLIASWRRTRSTNSVPNRMAEAYSEAAISVTITSLTNVISFTIGLATPYKQTQIYATFCASAVLFCYISQIIFFGACMALSGYREEKNLHALTFRKVPPKSKQNFSKILNNEENCQSIEEKKHVHSTLAMVFFRDTFSNILINRHARTIIILMFGLYLIAASVGCYRVVDGPEYQNGFQYNSSAWKYVNRNYKYFGDYPHRVQVIIDEELDYSDPAVQANVEDLTKKYETAYFSAGSEMTEHWLRSYKAFLNNNHIGTRIILKGFNTSNSQDFYYVLRNIFFKIPVFKKFSTDVVFHSNSTKITQSRFIIQTKNIHDATAEKRMLEAIYRVTDSCEYKTVAFCPIFRLVEQSMLTKGVTIQTIICTAVTMIVMFFIFVPNIKCAVAVAICICSIEIGVIGYMSFWNINLDPLSLVCLIMSVGFSVDFASHVAYSYANCKDCSTEGRIRYSMYSAGMPVMQGAASTILGVIFLLFTNSNSFLIIFKIIFLSMLLANLHSLFLLPVLLSLIIVPSTYAATDCKLTVKDNELKKLNNRGNITAEDISEHGNNNQVTISHSPNY